MRKRDRRLRGTRLGCCVFGVLLLMLHIWQCPLNATAAEAVALRVSSAECSVNRIVTVDVTLQSHAPLTAAYLEFAYNTKVLTFQKLNTVKDNITEYVSENGVVRTVCCMKKGCFLQKGDRLFSLRFKAHSAGSSDIKITLKESSDAQGNLLAAGELTGGTVTVNGSGSGTNNNDRAANGDNRTENNQQANGSRRTNRSGGQSGYASDESDDDNASDQDDENDNSDLSSVKQQKERARASFDEAVAKKEFDAVVPLLIGGFGLIILLLLSFFLGQRIAKRKLLAQPKNENEEDKP